MSGKYGEGREAFARGEISWTGGDVKVILVSDAYNFDASHSLKDLDVVGEAMACPGRRVTSGGWAHSGRLLFKQVTEKEGRRAAGLVWYAEGGALIFHSNEIVGFPMRPNGGDIDIEMPERGLFRV